MLNEGYLTLMLVCYTSGAVLVPTVKNDVHRVVCSQLLYSVVHIRLLMYLCTNNTTGACVTLILCVWYVFACVR